MKKFAAAATLLAGVLIVHAPELAGVVTCNPLAAFSGLGLGAPVQILPGQCYIDGNAGMTTQALGHLVAEDWLHLRLPWWNPFAGFGLPLAAEMQPAAFFLPFVLLLHFASGILLLKMTMQMLAGLCMYACLRRLPITPAAALAGALLYALNGTFAWFGDAPSLPVPFLPLLIYGIEASRAAARPGRYGGAIAIALGLGLSLLAGFPETAFVDGLLALCWFGLAVAQSERAERLPLLGRVGLGGMLGLCLSAPAVVPFLDGLTRDSLMLHRLVAFNRLEAGQAVVLLMPTAYGPPYADWAMAPWSQTGGYLGVGMVLPAAYAMVRLRTRSTLRVLLCAWVVFWVCVFLHAPLVQPLWRAVPVLNMVEVTRYAMPSLEFAGAVLAALGVDDWRHGGKRRTAWGAVGIVAVLLGAAMATALAGRTGFSLGAISLFLLPSLAWAILLAAALGWLLARPARTGRLGALGALMAADGVVSFLVPVLAGSRPRPIDPGPVAYLRAHAGLSRVYNVEGPLAPNYGSYFDIATIRTFYEPVPQAWDDYIARLDPRLNVWLANLGGLPPPPALLLRNLAAFEAAGTRYALVSAVKDPFANQPDSPLRPVFDSPTSRLYELPGPAPYFAAAGGPCRLAVRDREHVEAGCTGPAILSRLEAGDPGWRATRNGAALPISPAGELFQQVSLPAGDSRIVFSYAPPFSAAIWAAFGAGLAGLAWLAARGRHRAASMADVTQPRQDRATAIHAVALETDVEMT